MNWFTKLLLPIALRIVKSAVKNMSPEIRKEVIDFVLKWEVKCKATANEVDDILVMVIKSILAIK